MNVTGVEWRDRETHDGRFFSGRQPRRARQPADGEEEDCVEIHGDGGEEPADGIDTVVPAAE